ncbi:MAG TPA: universal stress protein [Acidimicrobiales bacterium]|nr:universal stress protein [Acidimicrobiales bacterium]
MAESNQETGGHPEQDTAPEGSRVVVGVSTSESSQQALAWAAREAALRDATLHVVFAWQYPFEMADGTYVPPMPNDELEPWAEKVVDEALASLGDGAPRSVRRDVRSGPAAAVLMSAAQGADLLVVGTSGHGRVTGLLLGSVSQFLAVHAPCPVVIVHGPRRNVEAAPAAAPATAHPEIGVLEEIGEEECLGLLAGADVGRLVVVERGQPLVFPMNYVLDNRTIGVRTDPGTKLDAATLGRVAFEVDHIDPATHEGWSVLVQGVGQDVTEGLDAWSARVRASGIEPWAQGEKQHWIAVAPSSITGRRIRRRAGGG